MEQQGIRTVVGAFIFMGLVMAAGLVIKFSQAQTSNNAYYTITVAFPTANGIIKNSRVLMAGVRIGTVLEDPRLNEDGRRALIDVGVGKNFSIREGSRFTIREIGLLGDRYIDVQPAPDMKAPVVAPGKTIDGTRTTGLGDLTDDAKPVMQKAELALSRLNNILAKVDTDILDKGTETDIKSAISRLNSILGRVDNLLAQAEKGQGIMAKVLNDKKMADDLRSFIYSLRKRGVLFYKDVSGEASDEKKHK